MFSVLISSACLLKFASRDEMCSAAALPEICTLFTSLSLSIPLSLLPLPEFDPGLLREREREKNTDEASDSGCEKSKRPHNAGPRKRG